MEESNKIFLVSNSKIIKHFIYIRYETNRGSIIIETVFDPQFPSNYSTEQIGNLVFQNNNPAPDIKYNISFMENIIIKNGKIVILSMF